MHALTTRDVNDINSLDRAAIEHLLGQPLAGGQKVFVMAYSAGLADDATRSAARQRLTNALAAQRERAKGSSLSADEADAAIDEAMQAIRPRSQ